MHILRCFETILKLEMSSIKVYDVKEILFYDLTINGMGANFI